MPVRHEAIVSRTNLYMVDPNQITIQDGWNPRTDFSGQEDLSQAIKENGVQVPLLVKNDNNVLCLVDGERRLRAVMNLISQGVNIKSVPCVFTRSTISEPEMMFSSLIRNDGKPLSPIEEASAYNRLRNWGVSAADISKRIGKSKPLIYRRLLLVDASHELRAEIEANNINLTDAEDIIKKSRGKIEEQDPEPKRKSNKLSAKEIKAIIVEKKSQRDMATHEDKIHFLNGYILALENVLDRTTIVDFEN